jgi:CRP/FNR family transcriptional regulator
VNTLSVLRNTELFRELDAAALGAVAANAVERRLQKDEVLFVAGETARGLYIVAAGSVRAYRIGADGREQVIHIERAGATIGELPLFDGQPYPSTVAAEEDSTVLFLEKDSVTRLCRAHPEIPMAALRVLSGRLRKCAELVETLSLRAVGQRLAQWVLAEAEARGQKVQGRLEVEISLSKEQIAARIGSVREVVSRAIARLEQEGLLHVRGSQFVIPDPRQLAEYIDRA